MDEASDRDRNVIKGVRRSWMDSSYSIAVTITYARNLNHLYHLKDRRLDKNERFKKKEVFVKVYFAPNAKIAQGE